MREQRLVYLRKLGAEAPRPIEPPKRAQKGPPPRLVQGEPRRYRFVYEKTGPAAFLSHLDVIRALPRSFRRLEIPLFYSSGFHPKPDMTFGPALSLGVASLAEAVDMRIAADLEPAEILEDLNAGAQPGIRFIGGARLGAQDAGVTRIIDGARYAVGVPRDVLASRGGEAWLRERIGAAMAASELPVVRRIDGIGKRVDVRSFLRRLAVGDAEAREAIARAGLVGDLVVLTVDVEVRGNGGVKIAEVVEALAGDAELPHRSVRAAMGLRTSAGDLVSPLSLASVREAKAQQASAQGAEQQADTGPERSGPTG
jgi:radical SAM-linked protein